MPVLGGGGNTISARLSTFGTALTLLLAACAGIPPVGTAGVPFAGPVVDLPARAAQVGRAAAGLGWRVEELAPGRVRASLPEGDGRPAVAVTIGFDREAFTIRRDGADPATPERDPRVAGLRDGIVAQSGL